MAYFFSFLLPLHWGKILYQGKGYLSYQELDILKALAKQWILFFIVIDQKCHFFPPPFNIFIKYRFYGPNQEDFLLNFWFDISYRCMFL